MPDPSCYNPAISARLPPCYQSRHYLCPRLPILPTPPCPRHICPTPSLLPFPLHYYPDSSLLPTCPTLSTRLPACYQFLAFLPDSQPCYQCPPLSARLPPATNSPHYLPTYSQPATNTPRHICPTPSLLPMPAIICPTPSLLPMPALSARLPAWYYKNPITTMYHHKAKAA
ncbi:hypothetical protein FKM82_005629, partial [Ascaphus truei]